MAALNNLDDITYITSSVMNKVKSYTEPRTMDLKELLKGCGFEDEFSDSFDSASSDDTGFIIEDKKSRNAYMIKGRNRGVLAHAHHSSYLNEERSYRNSAPAYGGTSKTEVRREKNPMPTYGRTSMNEEQNRTSAFDMAIKNKNARNMSGSNNAKLTVASSESTDSYVGSIALPEDRGKAKSVSNYNSASNIEGRNRTLAIEGVYENNGPETESTCETTNPAASTDDGSTKGTIGDVCKSNKDAGSICATKYTNSSESTSESASVSKGTTVTPSPMKPSAPNPSNITINNRSHIQVLVELADQ